MDLAIRLDDIITRLTILRKEAESEDDPNILYCILNRISMYEEEKKWVRSVLGEAGGVNG